MAQQPVVEEAAEGEAAPPAKSKKKLIIIIAAAVLLLGGGGGAAWFFMGHKSADHKSAKHSKEANKEEGGDAASADEGEKAKEAEGDAAEEGHGAEPLFVKLETFTLNLNPEEGEKYLQVDISISPSSKEEGALLEAHMPQVRNRILMLLTSKKPSEISTMEGKQALSKELVEQLNQPYGNGGKKLKLAGVYFTSFVIQ